MMSQPGLKIITKQILPNISWTKSIQTMKLWSVIEYNTINILLQKLCRKWDKETNSRPLFVFWKSFIWGKSKWSTPYFQYISIIFSLAYYIKKLHKILDYWSRDMLNFDFWEKDLGAVSPPHSVHDFLRKILFVLYSNNWPNFIVRLLLLLENWAVCILELLISQFVTS